MVAADTILFILAAIVLIIAIIVILNTIVYAEPEIRTFEDCLKAGIIPKLCIAMFPQVLQGANFTGGFPFP